MCVGILPGCCYAPPSSPARQGTVDLRTYGFEPAEGKFPGNASVVYVVDADDSYTVVRPEDVKRWGTTVEELHEIAVTVPGLRRQIVREYGGPAAYAAPMENVFVALPLDLLEVQRDFETSDNPFSPDVYVERDGKFVVWK